MEIKPISYVQAPMKSQSEVQQPEAPAQTVGGAKKLVLALTGLAIMSTAGMGICKDGTVIRPMNKTGARLQDEDTKMNNESLSVDFVAPKGVTVDFDKMQKPFEAALTKLIGLEKTDKNYSWIDLPAKLINEKYVDNVYATVEEFKKPFKTSNNEPQLIFVALGNPANGDELVKASGLAHNVTYACDITPAQMKDTIKKAGGNLANIQVIISSKSGSTFESNQTYKLLTAELTQYYEKQGLKPEEVQKKVAKHFLMLTDKNPEKSTLKQKASELGIKTIDCVDNLHSAFGDVAYSMPILAYAGMPKDSAKKMLEAADKMSKKLMNKDFSQNTAARMAAFDKIAEEKGAQKEQFIFHDAHFSDFSSTMEQIYKESLRKLNFTTSVYPRSAHSGLETDISRGLKNQPISIITNVDVEKVSKSSDESKYFEEASILKRAHELNAQNEGHFQKNIVLKLGAEGVTPESLGEFVTLKSFVAYFKNEFETGGKNDMYNQSYVSEYKNIRKELEKSDSISN